MDGLRAFAKIIHRVVRNPNYSAEAWGDGESHEDDANSDFAGSVANGDMKTNEFLAVIDDSATTEYVAMTDGSFVACWADDMQRAIMFSKHVDGRAVKDSPMYLVCPTGTFDPKTNDLMSVVSGIPRATLKSTELLFETHELDGKPVVKSGTIWIVDDRVWMEVTDSTMALVPAITTVDAALELRAIVDACKV